MPGKIGLDSASIIANIAKVNRFPTLSEQEECIELREKLGRRLVDGNQNGLSGLRKFP
jgi:hypothetical protein